MKYQGYELLLCGLLTAAALVFPVLFHAVGLGSAFLPMFYPITAAGFLVSPLLAVTVGVSAPLLSAVLTGMPPLFPPVAPIMMVEGLVLAGLPALLYQHYRLKVLPTLALTLAVDRLVLLGLVVVVSRWLNLPPELLGTASVLRGLPGIAAILVLIPPVVTLMMRRKQQSPFWR